MRTYLLLLEEWLQELHVRRFLSHIDHSLETDIYNTQPYVNSIPSDMCYTPDSPFHSQMDHEVLGVLLYMSS